MRSRVLAVMACLCFATAVVLAISPDPHKQINISSCGDVHIGEINQ